MDQPPALSGTQDVLVVDGVVRRFGDLTAVDGVSFHIAPGETYGLLGPNGAGKTTTISIIAGLLAADAGAVTVAGERMGPQAVAPKRHIGLVPQVGVRIGAFFVGHGVCVCGQQRKGPKR